MGSLDVFWAEQGFSAVRVNLPGVYMYQCLENGYVNAVCCFEEQTIDSLGIEQLQEIRKRLTMSLGEECGREVHSFALIECVSPIRSEIWNLTDPSFWIVSQEEGLIIPEGHISDFYGIRAELERFLLFREENEAGSKSAVNGEKRGAVKEIRKIFVSAPITCLLVFANILLFLLCAGTGDLLYNEGMVGLAYYEDGFPWYRLITSLFLHENINHLFSNMILLYYIGILVERKLGHFRFALLYILSGIAGNLCSMAYEWISGVRYFSLGASGAVFGVIGGLLILVLLHKGKLEHLSVGRVAFVAAFSVYTGFTETGVNNAAHVGGLVFGMVVLGLYALVARITGRNAI